MGTMKGSKMTMALFRLDDYKRVKKVADKEKLSVSSFIRSNIMRLIEQYEQE